MSNKISGRRKAAILMISLGLENSSVIFSHLKQEEIEDIIVEIANIKMVEPKDKKMILDEFYEMCLGQEYLIEGGLDYAKLLLEQSLGSNKSTEIIAKLTKTMEAKPFESLRKMTTEQIYRLLENENPQFMALVLSYLTPVQASGVMEKFDIETSADLTRRIARMGQITPQVLAQMEKVMEVKSKKIMQEEQKASGGVDTVVDIINSGDREKSIMEYLERKDPELAKDIRKHIFMFDDVIKLDQAVIRKVFTNVEIETLVYIMGEEQQEINELILGNVTKRMAERIQEELSVTKPTDKQIEEGKQELIRIIRALEAEGEIQIK